MSPPARTLRMALWIAGLALAVAAVTWGAGRIAAADATRELKQAGAATLALDLALLDSELQRHRATPVILATEGPLETLLRDPSGPARAVVNARLEALAAQTGAADLYVLDAEGLTVAASNYRSDASFVGTRYAFRPYFRDAMAEGRAEYFGLGVVSGAPGLYISRRIDGPAGPLGVVVTKVHFTAVEAAWRRQGGDVVVADPNGVILLSNDPARRFTTLDPLPDPQRAALRATRQFGDSPLDWSGARPVAPDRLALESDYRLVSRAPVGAGGWRLEVWTPTQAVAARAAMARWLAALGTTLALLAGAGLWRAARQSRRRAEAEAEARRRLEDSVSERTRALTDANARLSREVAERREAEARLRTLQADLVQANRLAQLGQTMAGVAHEINQPVAAIRTNADNALVLLDRRDEAEARANLTRIQSLTGRIGAVIEGLRGLARKAPAATEPVRLSDAIEGAVLLLDSRNGGAGVRVYGEAGDLWVMAERVRLEQVLVNLLQNAFEAVAGQAGGAVALGVEADGRHVRLAVSDNGPGVSPAARASLFTPFATGKPNGLGLGLVISRDIVAGFGGTLALDPAHGPPGARFVVRLKRAAEA